MRYVVLAACLLLAGALFVVSFSPGWFGGRRPPTQSEQLLAYFAEHVAEPALCGRIPWSARETHGVFFGGGTSYTRSDCFELVAERRRDTRLCWNARPLADLDPFSPGFSAWACRRRTRHGEHGSVTLPDDVLVHAFERMGYDIDRMPAGVFPPAIALRDVYAALERDPAAIARARQQLLSASPEIGMADIGYVADLVAIATGDATWCDRVPPRRPGPAEGVTLRDWCYFTVARNSNDPRPCARMTPAAADPKVAAAKSRGASEVIAGQASLRAQCEHSGAGGVGLMTTRYAPEVPPDPGQAERVIVFIGAALPSARAWPPIRQAAYFQNFLYSLWPDHPDPTRDAARDDLIRRVQTFVSNER